MYLLMFCVDIVYRPRVVFCVTFINNKNKMIAFNMLLMIRADLFLVHLYAYAVLICVR